MSTRYEIPMALFRFLKDEESMSAKEIAEALEDGDFHGDRFRIIHDEIILDTLADELESDEYILGCFNADFIADVMDWPVELVEAAQKGEAYAAIGQGIIDRNMVRDMAEAYAKADGYGHHFASYDGHEKQIGDWWIFRTN